MKRFAPIAFLALVSLLAASPALSCTPYIGAHTGLAITSSSTSGGEAADRTIPLGGTIGVDCAVSIDQRMFAGLASDFDLYGLHDGSIASGASGGTLDKSANIRARVGYYVTPYTAVYGTAGYGWLWLKDASVGPVSLSLPTFAGPVAGFGVETRIAQGLSLDLGYLASFAMDKDVTMVGGPPANIESINHAFRVGLKFSLSPRESVFSNEKEPEPKACDPKLASCKK